MKITQLMFNAKPKILILKSDLQSLKRFIASGTLTKGKGLNLSILATLLRTFRKVHGHFILDKRKLLRLLNKHSLIKSQLFRYKVLARLQKLTPGIVRYLKVSFGNKKALISKVKIILQSRVRTLTFKLLKRILARFGVDIKDSSSNY